MSGAELASLRAAQAALYRQDLVQCLKDVPWGWPLVCNGVFIQWTDLQKPPERVVPVGAHTAGRFEVGRGFDVNPVTWEVLALRGIPVRGPAIDRLGVYRNAQELRRWTRLNLDSYWRRWARDVSGVGLSATKALWSHYIAWGVLGVARMQFTISTGEVASKQQAGAYALRSSAADWHPLILETLRYWSGEQPTIAYRTPRTRRADAARFAASIVEWGTRDA